MALGRPRKPASRNEAAAFPHPAMRRSWPALLLAAPLRITTLISLSAEEHIIRSGSGPRAVVHLMIPAANVKNRIPLEFVLPSRVVELFDVYWERFRARHFARFA